MAFSRSAYDNGTRPWLHAEVWVADVATRASKKVLSLDREAFGAPGPRSRWSPDSKALAFCASAKEVLEGEDPAFSVYENNLYAVNVDRPSLVNLSDGFIPNVGGGLGCSQITWNSADGKIYVPVDAGARTVPARTKRAVTSAVERTTLEVMRIPNEVMSAADVAGTSLVAATEGPTTPPSLYRIDLATGASTAIAQPNAGALDGGRHAGMEGLELQEQPWRGCRGMVLDAAGVRLDEDVPDGGALLRRHAANEEELRESAAVVRVQRLRGALHESRRDARVRAEVRELPHQ